MFSRLLRSAITLASVVVAYQLYVLLAVPWLEPRVHAREQQPATAVEHDRGRQLVKKYQQLLASYFPADHWCQKRAPIVIKSGQLMLVLDEYHQRSLREIELKRLAVLFFPTPLVEGHPAPPDAVIVEVPGGASFRFDAEFNPATSTKAGRIESGQLDGPIVIRSEMREAGPADNLHVETRDLRLDNNRLETQHPVKFQLGRNKGSGRHMEIRFVQDPQGGAGGAAAQFDRLQSLEILHDVRCQFALSSDKLLAEDTPAEDDRNVQPPVEVSCRGSFEFVFASSDASQPDYVATFRDDVQVWQFNPAGQSDTMTCSKLALEFAPRQADMDQLSLDGSQRQRNELGLLEPYVLDAVGEPVILLSPARGFEARGLHLRITLPERRIALDGGNVRLTSGRNVLRAPALSYTHPAKDAKTRIGTFRAQGPGSLDFAPNPQKPDEVLRAQWSESVNLAREGDQPVLSMTGRPQLAMEGRGRLIADRMKVYLRERATASGGIGAGWLGSGANKDSTVIPDRLSARGNVIIDSPQLSGQTHELAAWFEYVPPGDEPTDEPTSPHDAGRFYLPSRDDDDQSYAIQADMLRLEIALRNRRAIPVNLSCDGHVVFRENRMRNPADAPLVLHGERLTVEGIDTGATRIAVLGGEARGQQPATQAEMTARGVTLLSRAVYVDEAKNRAWIDGSGEAQMRLDRDLQGRPVSVPYLLKVRWQEGLDFDGRQVELRGDVFAEGPDDWLRSDRLVATLTRPIRFGEQVERGTLDLAAIDCQGRVVIDHRARDTAGPTSHERMELERLAIDQQSGAIDGSGPGTVRSVHYGDEITGVGGQSKPPRGGPRLHYLRVDFQRGITGNLHARELSFQGRVRTIYGPVDAWEQELDPAQANVPMGAVLLSCHELTVSEDPNHPRDASTTGLTLASAGGATLGPMELIARGNVRIDTADEKNHAVQATAERASYDQLKELFVLEGDGRTAASIRYQQAGSQPQQFQARKIMYHRSTGQVQADDVQSIDISAPAGSAFAPRATRGPSTTPPR
jgi:lipopolysaccharide export system protein LptA